MIKHRASAVWKGTVKEGSGSLTTKSKVFEGQPYSFKTRFENGNGTNPDELIAASHAGCYAMAFSMLLGKAGFTPDAISASAEVTMDPDKLELTGSHLTVSAKVPGISEEQFQEIANMAKEGCPISKALSFPITLDASLEK